MELSDNIFPGVFHKSAPRQIVLKFTLSNCFVSQIKPGSTLFSRGYTVSHTRQPLILIHLLYAVIFPGKCCERIPLVFPECHLLGDGLKWIYTLGQILFCHEHKQPLPKHFFAMLLWPFLLKIGFCFYEYGQYYQTNCVISPTRIPLLVKIKKSKVFYLLL